MNEAETTTLYTVDGYPVEIDLTTIEQNQATIIEQNETLIKHYETVIKNSQEQIAIEKEINQCCVFCFVMLVVLFIYRIFHSVMSF